MSDLRGLGCGAGVDLVRGAEDPELFDAAAEGEEVFDCVVLRRLEIIPAMARRLLPACKIAVEERELG